MKALWLVPLLIFLSLSGCSNEPAPPQSLTELPPLTLEQWKVLPVEEKYDAGTFERLREADRNLRSDRAWQKFMKDVVIPERKNDIPGIPGQS
jgi:hypothetical protein